MTKADAVIEHEGVKYRRVEREAVEGDYVVITNPCGGAAYEEGDVFYISGMFVSGYTQDKFPRYKNGLGKFFYTEEYAVLEPIKHAMPKLTDAEPGDTVRITNADDIIDAGYKNGDTFTIDTVWGDRKGADAIDNSGRSCELFAEEFEVVRDKPTLFDELTASLEQAAQIAEQVNPQAERIAAACADLSALLIRKNHDYGDSFAKQYEKYGLVSALIRMDDKMRRLETLVDGNAAQVGESIEDTLIDLAGYALLAAVELRKAER